jgi:predicted Zn-dependent protease
MSRSTWNLDQLKSELSRRKEVKNWIITEENVHRRERYFMADGQHLMIDQDRNVHGRTISIRIFVHLPQPGRQGEITKKLFPSISLKTQIDSAIESALQTDHQVWELPVEVPKEIPLRETTDPRMAEDLSQVMTELTQRVQKSVNKQRETTFNSAELFLSVHHRELHLSNGLTHRNSQSRIYTEAAFSYAKAKPNHQVQSDEYLTSQWAVHLDHLPIEKLFDEASENAQHSLDVVKPFTGKYAVLIDAEVLSTLVHGQLSQLSAGNSYNGLPFIKPGSEFIPSPSGDLMSITLDPSLKFGANTVSISDQGMIQAPLKLVENNQVVATATDKQYGDYLNLKTTTVRGNLVIEPGTLTYQELTQYAPVVIEILQFSGLFADPNSGTFSSEIRLARLYDNQRRTIRYLKGGSLSGSVSDNFKGLRLSQSRVNRSHFSSESAFGQGYFGPEHALLSEVSIVG